MVLSKCLLCSLALQEYPPRTAHTVPDFSSRDLAAQCKPILHFNIFSSSDYKTITISFLVTIIHLAYMIKNSWSIEIFIKSKCLSGKTIACFGGKHRRNVFTLQEIVQNERNLLIFTLFYNILIIGIQSYSDKANSYIYFVVHNLIYVSFVDIYSLVLIPLKQLHLCNSSIWFPHSEPAHTTGRPFYVSRPGILTSRKYEAPPSQQLSPAQSRMSEYKPQLRRSCGLNISSKERAITAIDI